MTKKLATFAVALAALVLAGCSECECKIEGIGTGGGGGNYEPAITSDIAYSFDIPQSQADCPTGTEYTISVPGSPELDGGPGIVDRDGGPGIRDRDNNHVTRYCQRPCTGGQVASGKMVIDWHNNASHVVAARHCDDP